MPLPDEPTKVWPPKEHAETQPTYRKWAAWWAGDVTQLAQVYASTIGFGDPVVDGRDRRPYAATLQPRTFHGAPPAAGALQQAKLHIPLAADIATTSADLLFGEPPVLVTGGDAAGGATQERLDDYMAGGLQAVLVESAEIAAAFGGVYLRVGWNADITDRPLFDAIPPDAAVPEFLSGHLRAVTFYKTLRDPGDGKTWRHLERHEPGRILHGLYVSGDGTTLGDRKALQAHPDTEVFAGLVGADGSVETGATGLCAQYVPNMRPNRKWRGSQLGRSDFDGIESVMDALDEAWSSWLRDLRLGKGRIIVPDHYLDTEGRGKGAVFDLEQEVFQQVNAIPGPTGGMMLSNVQFQIRVNEHRDTTQALLEQAVRGAGYSAQSFGMQGDAAITATEVNARQSRSFTTRGKKVNYYRPPLARLARAALEVDVKQFKPKGVAALLPDVEWPDGIATDPQSQAQTLQLLRGAEAASTRTLVELLHPDWDDARVEKEVAAIKAEGQPPPAAGGGFPPPGTAAAAGPKPPPGAGPAGQAQDQGQAQGQGGQGQGAAVRPATPPPAAAPVKAAVKAPPRRPVLAATGRTRR